MKTINIYPQDIVPNAKYMHDGDGRMDLLGQMFYTGYGIRVPIKTRTPQDLDSPLHPFTRVYRRYALTMTPLTQSLLDLSPLPGKKQVTEANVLLLPYNIQLVIATEIEAEKILAAKPTNLPKLDITNLLRTSQYQCECTSTSAVSSLTVVESEDDSNTITYSLHCPYCWNKVPEDKTTLITTKFPLFICEKVFEQERRSNVTNIRRIDSKLDNADSHV